MLLIVSAGICGRAWAIAKVKVSRTNVKDTIVLWRVNMAARHHYHGGHRPAADWAQGFGHHGAGYFVCENLAEALCWHVDVVALVVRGWCAAGRDRHLGALGAPGCGLHWCGRRDWGCIASVPVGWSKDEGTKRMMMDSGMTWLGWCSAAWLETHRRSSQQRWLRGSCSEWTAEAEWWAHGFAPGWWYWTRMCTGTEGRTGTAGEVHWGVAQIWGCWATGYQ